MVDNVRWRHPWCVIMTSASGEAVHGWSGCRCMLTFWSVVSLSSSVYAAHSLSVLDSKLSPLYQTFQQPYGAYEPSSDHGYATRNAFQPAAQLVDDGYNTRTVPFHQDHVYPHYADGYATRNVFQRHYAGGKEDATSEDVDYHTRTTKSTWFPLYQPYQHSYDADPAGFATRNAFQPYRSVGQHQTKDAAKSHLGDDGYQTRTGASEWLPLHPDYQHPHDPGGYATQNAFQPYRSAVEVADARNDAGYQTKITDGKYATKDLGLGETVGEGQVVYRQFYDVDDDDRRRRQHHVNNYITGDNDDAGLTTERSRERLGTPSAAADYHSSNSFHHQPTVISTDGGWRSAVGRQPRVELRLPTMTNTRVAAQSGIDITIDRFGQEEDVTGASFAEPIGRVADRTAARSSSRQTWRSLGKRSDTARLSDPSTKFDRQRPTADEERSDKFGACLSLPDGDYPLDERFHSVLPRVNARCNFIKCAHRATFINPCSIGTRNPDHDLDRDLDAADPRTTGAHYCSVRDVDNYCHQHYYRRSGDEDLNNDQHQLHTRVKHYYFV